MPTPSERYLTTQHERDAETGYDNRGVRLYDSETGRFISTDPLGGKYMGWSTYNYVMGNPVMLIDPDGMSATDIIISGEENGKTIQVQWTNGGDLINLTDGGYYKGNSKFICEAANDLNLLYSAGDKELTRRIDILDKGKNKHFVAEMSEIQKKESGAFNQPYKHGSMEGQGGYESERGIPTGSRTFYDPSNHLTIRGNYSVPESTLAHELLGHGYDNDQGLNTEQGTTSYGVKKAEVKAVQIENRANAALGKPERTSYGGITIPKTDRRQ